MCLKKENVGVAVVGFFAGAFLGAGIALLYAPLSGRETREEIGDVVDKARKRAGNFIDGKKDAVKDLVAKVHGEGKE